MNHTTTILKKISGILRTNLLDIFFVSCAFLYPLWESKMYNTNPEIIFLNVGQGDSILVQQGKHQMLVDTGPDDSVIFALSKYMPWYDREIDIVVLTHPHDDHIAGIYSLLKKYKVNKIYYNPVEYDNAGYKFLLENYSDILTPVVSGDNVRIGDIFGIVIYPFSNNNSTTPSQNINNDSIVMLLYVEEKKILLTGDAEEEVEEKIVNFSFLNDIFILKAGHHCSNTSSSEKFLKKVSPEIAICSCGKDNVFGHPSEETLEKFEKYNIKYLITYQSGDVKYVF